RMQVLNTVSDVLSAYYNVVRQKQQLIATDEIMAFNQERVKITESRLAGGLGAKPDVLQAKIDLNVQKENRIQLQLDFSAAQHALNALLARDVLTTFDVSDSIPLKPLANRAELESKMISSNPALLAMRTQLNIANLEYRETRSLYYPRVIGTAGYNFTRSQNTAGFTLYNQTYGWNAGLTLSMPLYTGGMIKRQTQLRRIDIANADFRMQQYANNTRLALHNALEQYDAGTASLELELENEKMARENMNLTLERLRLGQGTALDVAQAQATLSATLFRLSGLRYQVKIAEINVHRQAADA
ncbi:MAG TPA: TolC family protein, partial [Bacteroidia bacterium]|nr:TolC family protein [Bacteroidia bacterium]